MEGDATNNARKLCEFASRKRDISNGEDGSDFL